MASRTRRGARLGSSGRPRIELGCARVRLRGLGAESFDRVGRAEATVRVGVERTQRDRFGIGLDRLLEELSRLREVQIANRLNGLGHSRVKLSGGAELRRRLPAIPDDGM